MHRMIPETLVYGMIYFFQDDKTLGYFRKGNYELGARASAVALKRGRRRTPISTKAAWFLNLLQKLFHQDARVYGDFQFFRITRCGVITSSQLMMRGENGSEEF